MLTALAALPLVPAPAWGNAEFLSWTASEWWAGYASLVLFGGFWGALFERTTERTMSVLKAWLLGICVAAILGAPVLYAVRSRLF